MVDDRQIRMQYDEIIGVTNDRWLPIRHVFSCLALAGGKGRLYQRFHAMQGDIRQQGRASAALWGTLRGRK